MNPRLDFGPAPRAAGRRWHGSLGRSLIAAVVAGLCVGCVGGSEPTPAGLPEGVTEFSPKVEPPKVAKPAKGKSVDTGSSAPAS